MDRRNFFRTMIGGVAAAAARTWPFRVYSFPAAIERPCWTIATGENYFRLNDLIIFCNEEQKKAYDALSYRITAVDQQERTITFEKIVRSQYNWKNLSRSPQPRRVGVT